MNKDTQEQIFRAVKEIRQLQITLISLQSQRQAANQRQSKLQIAVRQQQAELNIKDTELERLRVEAIKIQQKA